MVLATFGISPLAEYRALTVLEHQAMIAVMKEVARQNRKARRVVAEA